MIEGIKLSIPKNFGCEIFNLGNSRMEKALDLIKVLENKLEKNLILPLSH